jgi:hypothetical protein
MPAQHIPAHNVGRNARRRPRTTADRGNPTVGAGGFCRLQFGGQAGTAEELKGHVKTAGATLRLMARVDVNGRRAAPVYR